MASTKTNYITADGVQVFYRSAGSPTSPVLLLLHGFPSSSHQFRNLIPLLSQKYHVIAPDLPGFGFTKVPTSYTYNFTSLTATTAAFLDALNIKSFSAYIFDYGAPVLFRLALQRPQAIKAIITQNGNAYPDGLSDAWAPIKVYWSLDPKDPHREALRAALLTSDAIKWVYVTGSPTPDAIPPEAYTLDAALFTPKNQEIQLDLIHDYGSNVDLYPRFHEFLRTSGVPVLVAWGKGDPFFLPAGAEAFRRDAKDVEVHLLDAGHFALETNEEWYAEHILAFLAERKL